MPRSISNAICIVKYILEFMHVELQVFSFIVTYHMRMYDGLLDGSSGASVYVLSVSIVKKIINANQKLWHVCNSHEQFFFCFCSFALLF